MKNQSGADSSEQDSQVLRIMARTTTIIYGHFVGILPQIRFGLGRRMARTHLPRHSFTLMLSGTGEINHGFQKLCKVEADLSHTEGLWTRKQGPDGPYDKLVYTIAIQFGGTELCARIEWVENVSLRLWYLALAEIGICFDKGTVRSGPISIIPEPIDLPPGGKNMS